jgi:hypothetical protein
MFVLQGAGEGKEGVTKEEKAKICVNLIIGQGRDDGW